MTKQVIAFLVVCVSGMLSIEAQPIYELDLISRSTEPSSELVSTRSAVVIRSFNDWRAFATQVHRQFGRMGIDGVFYIKYNDLHASSTVERTLTDLFDKRLIKQVFVIDQGRELTRMAIIPRTQGKLMDLGESAWVAEGATFSAALLTLGLKMKSMNLSYTNFLLSDEPDFVQDLPLVEGIHLKSYPTGVKRFPLAVTLFNELEVANNSEMTKVTIQRYNEEIQRKNDRLRSLFVDYPHEVEFVYDQSDEQLYNQRFQYVLRFLHTSGPTIERLLNYPSDTETKDFVSTIPTDDGGKTFKTFGREEEVYKFYVKQTYSKDVYVGRYWDADESWELALGNYIGHMLKSFEK